MKLKYRLLVSGTPEIILVFSSTPLITVLCIEGLSWVNITFIIIIIIINRVFFWEKKANHTGRIAEGYSLRFTKEV